MTMLRPTLRKPAQLPCLDPRTLGRPVHLLPTFTSALREDLADLLRTGLNRRYRAAFQIGQISITPLEGRPDHCHWYTYTDGTGLIGFALERQVLLSILGYRYGNRSNPPANPSTQPVTATETRLARTLGHQFATCLMRRISATGDPGPELAETAAAQTTHGTWILRVEICEPSIQAEGLLWLTLDDIRMQQLFASLSVSRGKSRAMPAEPLAHRLPLALVARLLEKEVALGTLLDLQVGDIIPVNLGATDVLIDGSRLFTARVAEHKGKLCLTAFDDTK